MRLEFQSFCDSFQVFPVKDTHDVNDVLLDSVQNSMISGTNPVYGRLESLKLFYLKLFRKRIGRDFLDRVYNFGLRFF